MSRLYTAAAAILIISVAAPGCSRNREIPTQLAPTRLTSIGVNTYLWRAAIDTVSFAPLLQADSNGGVIVTDWYSNPNSPGERVKLTVAILDQELRADALRVSAARQVLQNGVWVSAPVAAATVQKLEDIILTRARDLRRTTVTG
jgi:alpha-beta hydrolase superfamily lysophospholipase